MKDGESLEDILNQGEDPLYHLKRVGDVQLPIMTIEDLYAKSAEAKAGFDRSVSAVAAEVGAEAITPGLKSMDRASAKAKALYDGDVSKLRDVLRASLIVKNGGQATQAFERLLQTFDVVPNSARNGYAGKIHSSDGYFDAKLDISIGGVYAEIQIHTPAMLKAKELAHPLYEKRQAVFQSIPRGHRPTAGQKREIDGLNHRMREIYKGANDD